MAERELQSLLQKLKSARDYSTANSILSSAKLALLKLSSLTPQPSTPTPILLLAREVTGEEKAIWWERSVAAYPDYADYQKKTTREIPVFVLTPVEETQE